MFVSGRAELAPECLISGCLLRLMIKYVYYMGIGDFILSQIVCRSEYGFSRMEVWGKY